MSVSNGFALRGFAETLIRERGADCSTDSINWMLDARKIADQLPWLTPPETVEITAKRYEREFKNPTSSVNGNNDEANGAMLGVIRSTMGEWVCVTPIGFIGREPGVIDLHTGSEFIERRVGGGWGVFDPSINDGPFKWTMLAVGREPAEALVLTIEAVEP